MWLVRPRQNLQAEGAGVLSKSLYVEKFAITLSKCKQIKAIDENQTGGCSPEQGQGVGSPLASPEVRSMCGEDRAGWCLTVI